VASVEVDDAAGLLARARALLAPYRFAAEPVEALCATGGPAYAERTEFHLRRLHDALDADTERFDDAVEAFVEMTVDVMRMQDRYFRTGQFDAGDAIADGCLYVDDDMMGRRYLLGLYLAQVFWPNHLEKLDYFEHDVVPVAMNGMRVLEVGTGPGTYGLTIGRRVECAELMLNDISPLSVDLVARMAAVDPVQRPDTLHFSTADFLDRNSTPTVTEPYDLVLFSEIVEHLADPEGGLDRLTNLLARGAHVFFATATNAAFYDHTIVFQTIDEIEHLLQRHGFEVLSSRTILAAPGPDGRDVHDYVALLRLSGSGAS
jgi:2-polyprenyl-3-methyl-5-hydroxy-6-metoxy-1,4-benzoquinol methylase